jgi:hypothetical protein
VGDAGGAVVVAPVVGGLLVVEPGVVTGAVVVGLVVVVGAVVVVVEGVVAVLDPQAVRSKMTISRIAKKIEYLFISSSLNQIFPLIVNAELVTSDSTA